MEKDHSLKAFVVLMKATRIIEDMLKKEISTYGINLSEFAVLEALYHKGELTVQQICQKVLINSGSMTYVIDKLVKKGLLNRKTSTGDRRVYYIQLTNEGRTFMDEIFPKHEIFIREIFSSLSEEEQLQFISMMKKIGFSLDPDR